MKTAFHVESGTWAVQWPGVISRHDVVFESPPSDPMQHGMPLGNGNLGALIWTEESKLVMALNRCDLFETLGEGELGDYDGLRTFLRHGCRIVVDFGQPLFHPFYVASFEGRLSLADATACMQLTGSFGTFTLKAFVAWDEDVFFLDLDADLLELSSYIEARIERYGSRVFPRWYTGVRRNLSEGLTGTRSHIIGSHAVITHPLGDRRFACALNVGAQADLCLMHSRCVLARLQSGQLQLRAAISPPLMPGEDIDWAARMLDCADKTRLFEAHKREWRAFWDKSYMETDDPYLDSLYHLALYYACSGQRGRYPGRFINSLWSWSHDVQPWNYYFHWNQQTIYWGLNAAGRHELIKPYLKMRFDGLDNARKSARQLGARGAYVADITDVYGHNRPDDNHTPVAEIALDFWRQYLYTCDKTFLREKALPYMIEAAQLFEHLFELRDDGFYHAQRGTAYEGWTIMEDACTELACGKALFTVLIAALDEADVRHESRALWEDMRDRIYDIPLVDVDPAVLECEGDVYRLAVGQFAGETVRGNKVLALGKPIGYDHFVAQYEAIPDRKAPPYRYSVQIAREMLHSERLREDHIATVRYVVPGAHPQANICAVFPARLIGLKDRGSARFDAAVLTALMSRDEQDTTSGWDPMPIALCQLGLAKQAEKYLDEYPSSWQYYNNGFGHYGWNSEFVADQISPFRMYPVKDMDTGDSLWLGTWRFRHMGLEPLGVFTALMNERLFQSADGVFRVAPAISKERFARFTLHAVGGFVVSAEISGGSPRFIHIHSLSGRPVRVENPWRTAYVGNKAYAERLIALTIPKGESILLTPEQAMPIACEAIAPQPNKHCRMRPDKHAMLGLPRID